MYRHNKGAIIALIFLALFASCSSRKTKDKLIADIEQYSIDTIVAKPIKKPLDQLTDAEKCRMKADNVLRKYPELFNAADVLTRKYNRWLECEEEFIRLSFVNDDTQRGKILAANKTRLSQRMEQMNVIEPLCASIYDENDAVVLQPLKLHTVPDEKAFEEAYTAVKMAILNTYIGKKQSGELDKRMTACELARMAWADYVSAFPSFLSEVPEQCRMRVELGMERLQRLHMLDLRNIYMQYWLEDKPGLLLPDDTDNEKVFIEGNKDILHFIK